MRDWKEGDRVRILRGTHKGQEGSFFDGPVDGVLVVQLATGLSFAHITDCDWLPTADEAAAMGNLDALLDENANLRRQLATVAESAFREGYRFGETVGDGECEVFGTLTVGHAWRQSATREKWGVK